MMEYTVSVAAIHAARMVILYPLCFFLSMLSLEVLSQDPIELTAVRLYSEGGILFGGAVEVSTSNGWERVCYEGFNSRMADIVCHKRGFDEGAMAVRSTASIGVVVTPLPSLTCQFTTADGEETVQCEYASTCWDHAIVICNYPGYLGCYRHTRGSPLLDEAVFAHANMTIQSCLALCRQRGYPHAGLAFGQECYCEALGIEALAARRLGNEDCFLPCVGDRLQICGGGTAVGIYDSRLGSCTEVYTEEEGAIASPGFPGKYSKDEHCTWTVQVANAANITVHVVALDLSQGDKVGLATPSASEYIAFTGGPTPLNVRFESTSHSLGAQLEFTFTGNTIKVTFNSTMTSLGAQGVVITFSSSTGAPVDPSMQLNVTTALPADTTITQTPTTGETTAWRPRTSSPKFITSPITRTTKPLVSRTVETDGSDAVTTFPNTATVEGVPPSTPRSITVVSGGTGEAPSIAVIVAIAVGIILILLLFLTAAVLFTSSYKQVRSRIGRQNNAHVNAAYAIADENDGQADSGIYDPGYDTADFDEPIYLSIRNDPRAMSIHRLPDEQDGGQSVSRNASVKTTKTDHDYQSVDGLSRRNTDRSYLSIYPDSSRATFTGGRVSPAQASSDACEVAEDGYMVPTPKNSTQIQLTKL
ncbi:uncharacterized protein LOC110977854 [Acanthaster planci]|uniref:Uncharacterized protein LOC110977854 n=1 Tax=Acanthaster planci TaxID=133434 RepID=A0A8B7Y669_ACAPL|nr:uncharacterized protein LOC110977854 [Acanthaster planci]